MTNLSIVQLKRAVQIKEQIARLENELSNVFRSNGATPRPGVAKPAPNQKPSGGMSAAARARLSAMAKARWAKIKTGNKSTAVKTPVKISSPAQKSGVRKPMSPEARAKLAATMKARWAKIKAARK